MAQHPVLHYYRVVGGTIDLRTILTRIIVTRTIVTGTIVASTNVKSLVGTDAADSIYSSQIMLLILLLVFLKILHFLLVLNMNVIKGKQYMC